MAKWRVTPKTQGNTMSTLMDDVDINKDTFGYQIAQDVSGHIEQAKQDRANEGANLGYRKAFTIPDVVAIEIKMNHGIDVFSQDFMHNPAEKARLFAIVETEYPALKSTEGSLMKRGTGFKK